MPLGFVLKRPSNSQGQGFLIRGADDLKRQRQSIGGETVWEGESTVFDQVHRPGKVCCGSRLVDVFDTQGRLEGRRGDQCIEAVQSFEERLFDILLPT